jgi:uncharacterized protein (DUF433 family)
MEAVIINRGRGPEIAGTRITVYDVLDYLGQGWHQTQIAALFRVSSEQIRAAADYIGEHRAEVLANYQRILDRHRNFQYPRDVEEKLAQCRMELESRKAALQKVREEEVVHAHDQGGQ